MATVSVSELTGAALDYAVGVAMGFNPQYSNNVGGLSIAEPYSKKDKSIWQPSTDWTQCGPLIDQHSAIFTLCNGQIRAEILGGAGVGENHKVAICRAVVAANLGNNVEIPEELKP